jgi:(S)-ureidoglycine aminohydrolase
MERWGPAPAQRFIYVLEGELELTAGGKGIHAGPGGFAFLPQGTPHTVRALGSSRAAVIEKPYERLAGDETRWRRSSSGMKPPSMP